LFFQIGFNKTNKYFIDNQKFNFDEQVNIIFLKKFNRTGKVLYDFTKQEENEITVKGKN
jgi:hypothetical protein